MDLFESFQLIPIIIKVIVHDFRLRIMGIIIQQKYRKKNIHIPTNSHISEDSIIGEYSGCGRNCSITKANIGRYCSIGNNVSIGDGEHPLWMISTNGNFYTNTYELLTEKECIIGNDVWIGVDSVIRRGATIGNSAVIGANSFVNKNIPEFAIAAGSPAKVIRYRFSPETIEIINESRWWDYDLDDAKKIIDELYKKIVSKENTGEK